jgi:nucleotide-binding universal stress UspA family protein
MHKRDITVAIDFSECSHYALDWALQNLVLPGDHLTLINVITPPRESHSASLEFNANEEEERSLKQLKVKNIF